MIRSELDATMNVGPYYRVCFFILKIHDHQKSLDEGHQFTNIENNNSIEKMLHKYKCIKSFNTKPYCDRTFDIRSNIMKFIDVKS